MSTNCDHIGDDSLEGYSRGALSEEESARVELHLLICEACRQRLSEFDDYLAALKLSAGELRRRERGTAADKPERRWRWRLLIPAFAALVLLAIAAAKLPLARPVTPEPFAISLRTMRGPEAQAQAPSHRPLALQLDLTGLAASPSYRIEMVDQSGTPVWQGELNTAAAVIVPPQKRGIYFVRVALPSGETLREYGLEIRGTD